MQIALPAESDPEEIPEAVVPARLSLTGHTLPWHVSLT